LKTGQQGEKMAQIGRFCLILLTLCSYLSATTYQDDSLVVRKLLDSEGLSDIPVEQCLMGAKSDRIIALSLSHLNLHEIPMSLFALTALTWLDLSDNHIMELPAEFFSLTQLTTLNLSYNHLTALPSDIAALSSLRILNLSNNKLKTIPSEMEQLTSLTELLLNDNKLRTLPMEMMNLSFSGFDSTVDSLGPLRIENNKFCQPDSLLASWIAYFAEPGINWRNKQHCNKTDEEEDSSDVNDGSNDPLAIIDASTGDKESIHAVPNPFAGKTTLYLPKGMICSVAIFNIQGQLIFEVSHPSPLLEFNGKNHPRGLYILKVMTLKDIRTYKLVLQ